ncbi:DNA-binding transcriptional MocR family regulator [Kitasatospora herbaricolor]|uniref:GntR family transcriptional regulator n=1 Tax=Kitasatospora herbaricolor TaxID=68217 RepID=UPI001E536B15|nr:winged helix-turn-helix domain-containing protein [Kitasatospora herbaricolor]MDQ0313448.1 DNA-binding transcriptional MocR family regulator [Kitasatospora herbaricolor]
MLLTFEVIAEALRGRIRSGGLKPGDALPTQAVLMAEYGASSLSVQKAMALLKQDGYAISRPARAPSSPTPMPRVTQMTGRRGTCPSGGRRRA